MTAKLHTKKKSHKQRGAESRRSRGASFALGQLHDPRLHRQGPAGRSRGARRGNLKGKPRHWFAFIRNASPATCSIPCVAIVARSSNSRFKKIAKAPSGVFALSSAGRPRHRPDETNCAPISYRIRAWTRSKPTKHSVLPSDAREYEFPAEILKELGAKKIRLLSNNPEKVRQLEESGHRSRRASSLPARVSKISRKYLKTKKSKMGHLLKGI